MPKRLKMPRTDDGRSNRFPVNNISRIEIHIRRKSVAHYTPQNFKLNLAHYTDVDLAVSFVVFRVKLRVLLFELFHTSVDFRHHTFFRNFHTVAQNGFYNGFFALKFYSETLPGVCVFKTEKSAYLARLGFLCHRKFRARIYAYAVDLFGFGIVL